jgi:predicted transcriptional regulator
MAMIVWLIVSAIITGLLMIVIMSIRNRREERRDKFLAGIKRGLEDYRQGKMKPWAEVKRDLGY